MVKEKTSSGLVLYAILNSFKPEFISSRALEFANMIKESEETASPKVHTYNRNVLLLLEMCYY